MLPVETFLTLHSVDVKTQSVTQSSLKSLFVEVCEGMCMFYPWKVTQLYPKHIKICLKVPVPGIQLSSRALTQQVGGPMFNDHNNK